MLISLTNNKQRTPRHAKHGIAYGVAPNTYTTSYTQENTHTHTLYYIVLYYIILYHILLYYKYIIL